MPLDEVTKRVGLPGSPWTHSQLFLDYAVAHYWGYKVGEYFELSKSERAGLIEYFLARSTMTEVERRIR